jgi:hypothetical protein
MGSGTLIAIEMLVVLGAVIGFGVWELRSLRRAKEKAAREAAAREPAARG